MFATIMLAVLVIAAIALFAAPKFKLYDYGTVSVRKWGFAPLIAAVLVAVFACTTIVQAKQVGVLTTFGKPSQHTLSSGLHWKAPWQKVTSIDATIQTDEYHGDSAIQVRLKDGNTAGISATIRWSVSEENAHDVYADFRSDDPTESLRDAVVSTQFKAAMNAEFASFDPLTLAGEGDGPDYGQLADAVEEAMLEKTNDLVVIDSITISLLTLDEKSQRKVDDYIGEVAKTRVAEQSKETATQQSEANEILSESVSDDPNVLVAKCLDLLAEGAFEPPAGFSCWPGDNGAVVIPGTTPQKSE